MEFNDIDRDVKHYALRGLDIFELFEQPGTYPFQEGEWAVREKDYISLLLLLPDDAERRLEIHSFIELFSKALYNGGHNARENKEYWEFCQENVKYFIEYSTTSKGTIEEPLEHEDYNAEEWGIKDTKLTDEVYKWLSITCENILKNYETLIK